MHIYTSLIFWASLCGLTYIYIGYPTLIIVLGRLYPRKVNKGSVDEPLSVIISVCNEEANIVRKLHSVFSSSISDSILDVIIASDGSTDNTVKLAEEYPDKRVRVLHFDERRGKPAVLNDVIPETAAELIVLTDARQEWATEALEELVSNFADQSVGIVSGELMFRDSSTDSTASQGVGFYWKYEKVIRKNESRFRSVPGATGAFYALRKCLFHSIPESTLLDDVAIPMQAIQTGARCIFESNAYAYDRPTQTAGQESIRKRRTIAGVVQLMIHHPTWLLPWKNPIWFEYISHKVMRLLSPLFMMTLMVSNIILADIILYQILLLAHLTFYLSGAIGWFLQKTGHPSKIFGPFLIFLTLNMTTVAALWDAFRGNFQVTWKRANTVSS